MNDKSITTSEVIEMAWCDIVNPKDICRKRYL
ncbi:hypothetical protein CH66_1975 [Francisella tularensis subsp. holarctica]|nr:hypothetical protein CH66_1975 [Francisella tularensis subsp. holarctica]